MHDKLTVWEKLLPWLEEHELVVFMVPFLVLVLVGLCGPGS